ncbi:MAG: apolipoprotein N-acyltransferase [Bacteroidales bacterium]|nr:apolipoprotein N-acyltransferase [Bacteroidales bacterium]
MMKTKTKIGLAFLSGLLIAAAWPTRGFAPLAFVAFIPLIYLQDRIGDKENPEKGNVLLLSFITFVTWNALTTWWVWKTTAAGTIGMILLNSIFMTTVFEAYHFVKTKLYDNKKGYYILIIFVLAFEFLHLNWQLNWPWLNLGNVFSHYYTWVQWYEWTGSAGGTAWVLVINILIYKILKFSFQNHEILFVKNEKGRNPEADTLQSQFRKKLIIILAVIFIPLIISKILYFIYQETGDDIEVVVVQPNLDPYSEEFTLTPEQILDRNLKVAIPMITENTRFVVSPESAIQENIWLENIDNYYSINRLRSIVEYFPQTCYVIGLGPYGMVPKGEENDFAARKFYDADQYYYAYNTSALITTDSIQLYHKSKLTPGVEAIPSWWFIRPLANMAIDLGGTSGTLKKDAEVRVLSFDNHKVGTLICYESAFGGYVTEFVKKGADMLFVITNDGWWGNTPGHRQHLEFSSLRAIETRRSIARSANTGISAFINQRGDIVEKTKYWEQTALRNTIKTNDKQTFYVRYGDYIYKVSVFLTALLFALTFVRIITKRK